VQDLEAYHQENLSRNKKIAARLWADHGIKMRYVDNHGLVNTKH
jgi:hypothetical protein